MKHTILNRMAGAAVALALPAVALAQDLGPDPSTGTQSSGSQTPGSSTSDSSGTGAYSSGGTFSSQASPQQGTFSSGIIVDDGSAYVIHKLQSEMALPDGSKVAPNGTITKSDGSTQNMEKGKVLSLDGRVMDGPFSDELKSSTDTKSGTGLTTPESPSTTPQSSEPSTPSSGVATPETGSPFSSPPAPDSSSDPALQDNDLGTSELDSDTSSSELSPDFTD